MCLGTPVCTGVPRHTLQIDAVMHFVIDYSWLIPLLPLIGAVVSGFFGAKWLKGQSHWPIWLTVGASAVMSLILLFGMIGLPSAPNFNHDWYTWITAGKFTATAGAFIDPLTSVMLCVVTGIGFLITVFAAGYMKGEAGYFRFFAYLGLFIFAMTILVMANNFVMLYLGWEGVGLCSYLLIGYYYERPSAREAAKKAFLVNRIGDFGFGLGIMLIFLAFGTVSFFPAGYADGVLQMATHPTAYQQWAMQYIPFLLMLGAFGKSAQFPLYVWLPDAMEGPTPVSALIHAATMVTAGVYMIVRCSTLFVTNEAAMLTIAAIGTFTAIFAATIALRQFDLKKVFAYSTISQLGFMFAAVGVLAPVAGIFHLVTHAFFKALLFLASGVVMHAMAGELDMRKMSGLKRVLPWTRWLMLIGCLALAGMFPFSGFFSKDEIVIGAFHRHWLIGVVLLLTALMTAYYTFRLYFRVFEGPLVLPDAPAPNHGHGHEVHETHEHATASASAIETGTAPQSGVDEAAAHHAPAHDEHGHHNHEPMLMILPLVLLAIGALAAGAFNFGDRLSHFLGQSPSFQRGLAVAEQHYELAAPTAEADYVDSTMWGAAEAAAHEAPAWHTTVLTVSILVALLGIVLAYLVHLKERGLAERLAARYPNLTQLLEAKYWVDEIYQNAIVEPLRTLGRVFFWADRWLVDGAVYVVGELVPQASGLVLKQLSQRGYLQGYALTMLFGIIVILLIVFL